jgi:ketosteroid isomerase-like protein
MSEQQNLETIKRMFGAFEGGGGFDPFSVFDEHIVWEYAGDRKDFPHAGRWEGKNGVSAFFRALDHGTRQFDFTIDSFHAVGDIVLMQGHEHMRAAPTGREYRAHWAMVFTFKNGKIVHMRQYTDTAAIADAFRK